MVNSQLQRVGILEQEGGVSLGDATSFTAFRTTNLGATSGEVNNYDVVDHNVDSVLNTTTGRVTPGSSEVWFLCFHALHDGANNGGSEWRTRIYKSGVDQGYYWGRNYNSGARHRYNNCNPMLALGNGSDYYSGFRLNGDVLEVAFSGLKIPNVTSAFSAGRANIVGDGTTSAITNLTEVFDLNNDFDPSLGEYTCPADGLYLFMATVSPETNDGSADELYLQKGAVNWGPVTSLDHNSGNHIGSMGQIVLAEASSGEVFRWAINASINHDQTPAVSGCRLDDIGVSSYFAARKVAASGTTGGDITGWTEDYDTGANFDASTGVFTAPQDGKYLIFFTGRNNTMLSSAQSNITCLKNSSSFNVIASELGGFGGSDGVLASHSWGGVVALSASDTLKLQQNASIMKDCYFFAALVGS